MSDDFHVATMAKVRNTNLNEDTLVEQVPLSSPEGTSTQSNSQREDELIRIENQDDIFIAPNTVENRSSSKRIICYYGLGAAILLLLVKVILKATIRSGSSSTYDFDNYDTSYDNSGDNEYHYGGGYSVPPLWKSPGFNLQGPQQINGQCSTFACKDSVQELLSSLNTSVDPCDNFYDFACQGWQNNNPRPNDLANWDVFSKLEKKSDDIVRKILEQSAQYSAYGYYSTDSQALSQAKRFYRSCKSVGSSTLSKSEETYALKPMLETLEQYGGWPLLYEEGTWNSSKFNWMKSMVDLKRRFGRSVILDISPFQSPDGDTAENRILIKRPITTSSRKSGLLQLTELDRAMTTILNFKNFIMNISRELLIAKGNVNINETYLEQKALEIIFVQSEIQALGETLVATEFKRRNGLNDTFAEMAVDTLQDILDSYVLFLDNRMDLRNLLDTLFARTPIFISKSELLFVADVDYLLKLSRFVNEIKPEALANYLHFQMAFEMAAMTTKTMQGYVDEMKSSMDGTTAHVARSNVCITMAKKKFAHVLGQAYVKKRYPSLATSLLEFAEARKIFTNIRQSLSTLISSTNHPFYNKTILLAKTAYTAMCVGHPSWIYDDTKVQAQYRGLDIGQSTFLEQYMAVNSWSTDKDLKGLREPLNIVNDECKWDRFPGTVGAFNEIMRYLVYLPAGIIQYPFFNLELPSVLNYGKLGTILGHEITHGLVGSGWSTYKNGSLTPTAKCFVRQYNNYTTEELREQNVTLDGELTLNENIPDNAGLLEAYKAYKISIEPLHSYSYDDLLSDVSKGAKSSVTKKPEGLEKYTDDQLFFIGFAQNFCESTTPENLRRSMQRDKHSPGMFRILGALKNSNEFAKAWNCPLGSEMNPRPEVHEKCSMF